jgi:hypothetical protein
VLIGPSLRRHSRSRRTSGDADAWPYIRGMTVTGLADLAVNIVDLDESVDPEEHMR